jgi:hypothetical protein
MGLDVTHFFSKILLLQLVYTMGFFTTKCNTVCPTEQLIPLLVMFVLMFPSLSQSQMMEMTPIINDYIFAITED